MASETEFSIVDRLGIDKLRLLLDIAAELASYTAGEQVSIADLAFDDRAAEQEIGRSRVREALLLFQMHGFLELDEAAKTLQPTQSLIAWARQDVDTRQQQLSALLQTNNDQAEPKAEHTPEPTPTPRPTPSRFGRGASRQSLRMVNNAKSDEELLAEIEPAPEAVSPTPQAMQPTSQPSSANLLASAVRHPSSVGQTSTPPEVPASRSRWGSSRSNGTTPNAAALRRPGATPPAEPAPQPGRAVSTEKPPVVSRAESKNAAGIVDLPTFFRLLDELNTRADRLRQAGLTDDPNIHIDLLQLIQRIQENG